MITPTVMLTTIPTNICRCCLIENPIESYNLFDHNNLQNELLQCVPALHIEPNDDLSKLICHPCYMRLREALAFRQCCELSECELRRRINEAINIQKVLEDSLCGVNAIRDEDINNLLKDINLDVTDVQDDSAIKFNQTTQSLDCDLGSLDVTILDDLLLNDCNFENLTSSSSSSEHGDPIINELLNSVLNDPPFDNNYMNTTNTVSTTTTTTTTITIPTPTPPQQLSPATLPPLNDNNNIANTDYSVASSINPTKNTIKSNSIHACPECEKKFTRNFQLKLHMNSVHNLGNGLQYNCTICEKSFASRHSLKYHQKSIHSTERPFTCPQCDRRFVLRTQLISHQRVHTGEMKPRTHMCLQCGKYWPSKSVLRTHMRSHNPHIERPFKCDRCEKSFFTRGHLHSHELVHTGEKPYACDYCDKSYQGVGNLNNHLMRRHSDIYKSKLSPAIALEM